ncbi:ClpP-like protease [Stenotrophomonas phage Philippe]|uniref:ClpP-like protease n=1 Tax=Stenotrophomonas phage Philippe TaxID=2859655 RepID=A0AAE7WPU7_9CAUD|nr:ClpP-like protease [Stenotrophomonas phage Philippe]QYW02228.1 ClpP-like protease [Stenotrophomonas phage Philippe]
MFPSQETITKQIAHFVDVHVRSEARIRPHFFLTGPTGTGKSYLTKKICEASEVPFFEINAAQLTAEGLSGNSLSKALRPLRHNWDRPNVIFVDEFDKLFQRNGESTEGFRNQVQDEFLHVLEAQYASVFADYGKYEPIKADNSLFIFAGAFNGQKIRTMDDMAGTGMRPEFVGRVPLVLFTEKVSMDELRRALPKTDLFRNYMRLFPETVESKAVRAICNMIESQSKQTNIGIRQMASCTHQYFMKDSV